MRPEGLTFNRPVTVEMPYRAGQMTEEAQLTQVSAFTSPRFMPDWQELAGTSQTATHTFVFEIEHFSIAALYRISEEDAACRCSWLGDWCAGTESNCADVSRISLLRDTEECAFTLLLADSEDSELFSETFDSCPVPENLELQPGDEDCRVTFDEGSGSVILTCGSCISELSQELCD